jgi:D-alanyl-D-alanine carboxypeptidase
VPPKTRPDLPGTRTGRRSRRAAGIPGVVVRVDTGKGAVSTFAEQAAWTAGDHRLKPDDQVRVGSNTKTMVAVLVLQLVAEKRLRLEDSVEKHLPGVIPNGGAITVKMLLNHTSGLGDNTDDEQVVRSVFGMNPRPWTPAELLAAGIAQPPVEAPGEKWSYSNTNYVALGMVLEKVSGRSLSALLDDRVIKPLRLKETYLATNGSSRDGRKLAHGYEPDDAHLDAVVPGLPPEFRFVGPEHDEHADVTAIDPNYAYAAGGVVSTGEDWTRFLTALLSGRLLPAAQLAQMRTMIPADPANPGAGSYGLGLAEIPTPCGPVYGHTGGIPGYRSDIFTDTTGTRSAFVVVTKQLGLATPELATAHQSLVAAAACTMYGKPVPAAPTP